MGWKPSYSTQRIRWKERRLKSESQIVGLYSWFLKEKKSTERRLDMSQNEEFQFSSLILEGKSIYAKEKA